MRIGICGSQSVGKTTVANALKNKMRFQKYHFFTERSGYLKSIGVPLNRESTFNGQLLFMAERAKELLVENMITDRTSIDVAAFTESSPNISIKEKAGITFLLLELAKQYDIIFYIAPTLPLVGNGVRDVDVEYRKVIDNYIRSLLNHPNIVDKVHRIKAGKLDGRVNEILKVVRNGNTDK